MKREKSKEDYLEAILQISLEKNKVKSIDVANKLGFSKPSVSVAMKKLKEEKLILVDKNGYISLTENGSKIAKETLEKHHFLTEFFISIGVDKTKAEEEACEIEHSLSTDTLEKLKTFVKK